LLIVQVLTGPADGIAGSAREPGPKIYGLLRRAKAGVRNPEDRAQVVRSLALALNKRSFGQAFERYR
jgi:hypothetical protein